MLEFRTFFCYKILYLHITYSLLLKRKKVFWCSSLLLTWWDWVLLCLWWKPYSMLVINIIFWTSWSCVRRSLWLTVTVWRPTSKYCWQSWPRHVQPLEELTLVWEERVERARAGSARPSQAPARPSQELRSQLSTDWQTDLTDYWLAGQFISSLVWSLVSLVFTATSKSYQAHQVWLVATSNIAGNPELDICVLAVSRVGQVLLAQHKPALSRIIIQREAAGLWTGWFSEFCKKFLAILSSKYWSVAWRWTTAPVSLDTPSNLITGLTGDWRLETGAPA